MYNIVGQAPSRTSDPDRPFESYPNRERLERLLGVNLNECRVVNLLDAWPGAAGKGDHFPMWKAKRSARVLPLSAGPVFLVGLKVAAAFGVEPKLFATGTVRGRPALVVPHPSGVSLWWNDKRVAEIGRRAVQRWKTKMMKEGLQDGKEDGAGLP